MLPKNQIALAFIGIGLISGFILSYSLPIEKLQLALASSSALVGAGLTQWTNKDDSDDNS